VIKGTLYTTDPPATAIGLSPRRRKPANCLDLWLHEFRRAGLANRGHSSRAVGVAYLLTDVKGGRPRAVLLPPATASCASTQYLGSRSPLRASDGIVDLKNGLV